MKKYIEMLVIAIKSNFLSSEVLSLSCGFYHIKLSHKRTSKLVAQSISWALEDEKILELIIKKYKQALVKIGGHYCE